MIVQCLFEVPDNEDIDPDKVFVTYSQGDEEKKVPCKIFDPEVAKTFNLNQLSPEKGNVLVLRYPSDTHPDDVNAYVQALKLLFKDQKVLALADDMKLFEQHPTESLNLLNQMIAHIKILS